MTPTRCEVRSSDGGRMRFGDGDMNSLFLLRTGFRIGWGIFCARIGRATNSRRVNWY
jgi:hypothetical protein